MKTQIIKVNLGDRSYPIYIGSNLLTDSYLISSLLPAKQLFIVTNTTIAPLYLNQLTHQLDPNLSCDHIILPDGEQFKTLQSFENIINALLTKNHDRKTLLCALGGGVIGDMTGFAAACYRRGVAYLQIPTTLLAQVDAAIGGKTGVNHALGKNMIGAIYQPSAVIIDIDLLQTLPEREYKAGLAEVIKYGLLADAELFNTLEKNVVAIQNRDKLLLQKIIARCCEIKADIVSQDETETGVRALLNLGHTFAHALETATYYQTWLHGEAVAIGLIMAADMSLRYGYSNAAEYMRINNLLDAFKLPTEIPKNIEVAALLNLMQKDKKTLAQQLRLVLIKQIGEAEIVGDFKPQDLEKCLQARGKR
jgi:3-dehydroquinate synthase